jgi:hypothetical protein
VEVAGWMGAHPAYEQKHVHEPNRESGDNATAIPTGSQDMIVVRGKSL